ncbi:MAG: DHHA1 domain-containing protein [Candidatus Pacearchaeota archaeon]
MGSKPEYLKKMKLNLLVGNEKRFFEFIKNLTDKDKIAVLSHNDGDGVCSAAITSKVIGKVDYLGILNYQQDMLSGLIKELQEKKINKIIILDLALFDEKSYIKEFEKFSEILVVDHHPFKENLNSEKTVFLKAPSEIPVSYMCYYLFSKVQEIPSWLAALGTLSDIAYKYTKENAEQIYDGFEFLGKKKNLWEDVLTLTMAVVYFKERANEIYDLLMKAKGVEDLGEIKVYAKIVEDEIKYYLKDFEKKKEESKDLVFYYYTSTYSINSIIINIVSVKEKSKTFIFVNKLDGTLRISSRRQDGKVNCNELLREAIKKIPNASAGGHKGAAGARLSEEYFEKFKKNLLKFYKKII